MKTMVIGGYGKVGSIVVKNLCKENSENIVVIAGRSKEKGIALQKRLENEKIEIRDIDVTHEITEKLKDIDTVIMCLENNNEEVLDACIRTHTNYIDITPSTNIINKLMLRKEDCETAKIKVVLGVGIAPGLSNMLTQKLVKEFDEVKKIDSFLMLGVGEQHGKDAIKWLVNNLNHEFEIDINEKRKRVRSFTGKQKVLLHDGSTHRFTRIDLADTFINKMRYHEAQCNSWFAYDVNYYTNLVCFMERLGIFRLLKFPKMKQVFQNIFALSMNVSSKLKIGTDRYEIIIQVVGIKDGKMEMQETRYHGHCNNDITAQIAAKTGLSIDLYSYGISFLKNDKN